MLETWAPAGSKGESPLACFGVRIIEATTDQPGIPNDVMDALTRLAPVPAFVRLRVHVSHQHSDEDALVSFLGTFGAVQVANSSSDFLFIRCLAPVWPTEKETIVSGSVNKVILVGRLGGDPAVRYTAEGTAVANFSLATDESFTDRAGDKQKRTEWHRIVAWKRLAEVSGEFLSKGKQVYVEGGLRTRKWQNREGNERTTIEIVATRIVMLGSKNGEQGPGRSETDKTPTTPPDSPAIEIPPDDDVLF